MAEDKKAKFNKGKTKVEFSNKELQWNRSKTPLEMSESERKIYQKQMVAIKDK